MKQISRKLQSAAGASMIIALLFMLVCVFVGGSVLVAATVNSNRTKDDRTTQQSILDQRSALSAFAELLCNDEGEPDIAMTYTEKSGVKTADDNPYTPPEETLKYIVCKVTGNALESGSESEWSFKIKDTDGKELKCTAVCDPADYTVYIKFQDNPQVQLRLKGRAHNGKISWYSGKIIKAG